MQFETLETVKDGFKIDGVFYGAGTPQHAEALAHIAKNDADAAAAAAALSVLESTREQVLEALELNQPIPAEVRQARAAARATLRGENRGQA